MKKEIENLEEKQGNVKEIYEKITEILSSTSRNKPMRRKPVYHSPLHHYIINLHKYTEAKTRQKYTCTAFITASENAINALENGEWNEEIVNADVDSCSQEEKLELQSLSDEAAEKKLHGSLRKNTKF